MYSESMVLDRGRKVGIEFIWQLEDCYEQKRFNDFFSLVSLDFRKGFLWFKSQMNSTFDNYNDIKLYIHLRSKTQDLDQGIHCYNICWSKSLRLSGEDCSRRIAGRSTIVLKRNTQRDFLYDIDGDNPFLD